MSRKARIVIPDCAHHVTQRGNNRQDVFFVDSDRRVYLEYLRDASERFDVQIEGYCLMTNHVHLVLRPHNETSLAEALKRINQLYAQYINRMHRRSGHLWQNRFFSCPLGENHFWRTMAYIERNPVRAHLARKAWRRRWSSAAAHCGLEKHSDFIDITSWKRDVGCSQWKQVLDLPDDEKLVLRLRLSTSRGRPLGTDAFIARLETLLGRRLRPMSPGRPAKKLANIKGKNMINKRKLERPKTELKRGLSLVNLIVNLINETAIYNAFYIDWKYKVPDPCGTNTFYTINTTYNTVYVTYGTPSPGGSELTVKRIEALCYAANDSNSRIDIADGINSTLLDSLPFGHDPNKQTDDWDLMWEDPNDSNWTLTGKQGECDEQARFMVKCLDLIGVSGSEWYNTYASEDTEVYNDQDSNDVGAETYWLLFDANGDGDADNYFEGSVKVPTNDEQTTFHYYTVVGPKTDAQTDCLLWRKLGPDENNWKQVWVYSEIGDWEDCWIGNKQLPGFQDYVNCQ